MKYILVHLVVLSITILSLIWWLFIMLINIIWNFKYVSYSKYYRYFASNAGFKYVYPSVIEIYMKILREF